MFPRVGAADEFAEELLLLCARDTRPAIAHADGDALNYILQEWVRFQGRLNCCSK